jgi:membrane-associated protease RseP (regulator of RpoE activity)
MFAVRVCHDAGGRAPPGVSERRCVHGAAPLVARNLQPKVAEVPGASNEGCSTPAHHTMKNEVVRRDELINAFKGVPLLGLMPDSPAELAGMKPGDLIVAVNGVRTEDVVDYLSAKERCKTAMQVVFLRDQIYYQATVHWGSDTDLPTAEAVAAGRATRLAP